MPAPGGRTGRGEDSGSERHTRPPEEVSGQIKGEIHPGLPQVHSVLPLPGHPTASTAPLRRCPRQQHAQLRRLRRSSTQDHRQPGHPRHPRPDARTARQEVCRPRIPIACSTMGGTAEREPCVVCSLCRRDAEGTSDGKGVLAGQAYCHPQPARQSDMVRGARRQGAFRWWGRLPRGIPWNPCETPWIAYRDSGARNPAGPVAGTVLGTHRRGGCL